MVKLVRGFKDILPGESEFWQHIEAMAHDIFENFGFSELRVPIMESTELFARGIGASTDIVEKEMYTFVDRNGSSLTLRPEATACVVRSYVEHKFYAVDPVQRFYTIGPMFRRERPQKGRYRQFHQINAEVFGLQDARADAELILLLLNLLENVGVDGTALNINSLGCHECRPNFHKALATYLAGYKDNLCPDCMRRMDKNPLRVFDCKVPTCREAMVDGPSVLDHLCQECDNHFQTVRQALDQFDINYKINHRLVRGLDYYTRTTFEVLAKTLGAQDAVAGGGRYDGLVKALGGPDEPGLGFAIGLERLTALLEDKQINVNKKPFVYVVALGSNAQAKAFSWVNDLRRKRIRTNMDFEDRSMKAQMRRANKLGASYTLIVGDNELESGKAVLRCLATKNQEDIPIDRLLDIVVERILG